MKDGKDTNLGSLEDMLGSIPHDKELSDQEFNFQALDTLFKTVEEVKEKKDDIQFSNMTLSQKDVRHVLNNFESHRIRLSDHIPRPIPIIKLGGKNIATVGDISTVTGQAKARKSYFLSAVLTAALNPNYYAGFLDVDLPPDRPKIIWIDTEQSKFWSQQILNRVKRSGVTEEEIDERIIYLNCRSLSTAQLKAITYVSLDSYAKESAFMILDGSRDLVSSVNNEDESTQLSRWLPEIAAHYNCNITNVLHQNPSGGSDSKMRGHLGTELMNKSEFVVQIVKHEKDKEVFIAKSMLSRDIGTDELCFTINDGLLEFTDAPVEAKNEKLRFMHDLPMSSLKNIIKSIFKMRSNYSKTNFVVALQAELMNTHGMSFGREKIDKEWLPFFENKGLVEVNPDENNSRAKLYTKAPFADTETIEESPNLIPLKDVEASDLPF
jgi:hypothetical protein